MNPLLFLTLFTAAAPDSLTGEIAGRVFFQDKPAAYANIIVIGTRRGAQSDEKGRYRITKVPAGSQTLRVLLVGLSVLHVPVVVVAGRTTERDLGFEPPGRPRGQSNEMRIGSDCVNGTALHAKRGSYHRTEATNPAGWFALDCDVGAPWELLARYRLTTRGSPLEIVVVGDDGEVVRRLRQGPGRASATVRWDGHDDGGVECLAGRYRMRFVTEADTVELECCLLFSPQPTRTQIEY